MYTVDSTKILINMNLEKLEKIYSMIKNTSSISIIKDPNLATVMVRANESVKNTTFNLGEILVTECEIVSKTLQNKTENSKNSSEDRNKMSLGYGLCMGNNENKAISMAILDKSLEPNSEKLAQDEEFVLLHIDGIDSLGFISSL